MYTILLALVANLSPSTLLVYWNLSLKSAQSLYKHSISDRAADTHKWKRLEQYLMVIEVVQLVLFFV